VNAARFEAVETTWFRRGGQFSGNRGAFNGSTQH